MNVGRVKVEGSAERVQYFYNDHLGARRAVTDGSGNVEAKRGYRVWGIPTVTNYGGYEGSSDVSYTGKERDQTGLYYFNVRYYDASLGRFVTEDPAGNGMNSFVYCGNNPLSRMEYGMAKRKLGFWINLTNSMPIHRLCTQWPLTLPLVTMGRILLEPNIYWSMGASTMMILVPVEMVEKMRYVWK